MIKEFLYDFDEKGKKVLTALVEDDEEGKIVSDKAIKYKSIANYEVGTNQLWKNYGKQVYVIFNVEGKKQYLDLNIFKDLVFIKLTEKPAYAFQISEDLADIILDYLDLPYPAEVVPTGVSISPKKGESDSYQSLFRGLFSDAYVQIRKEGKSYFVAQEGDYYLTPDIQKAKKIHKSDVRIVLVSNRFIDRETLNADVNYSPYPFLKKDDEYVLIFRKILSVKKENGQFTYQLDNFELTDEYNLCKGEDAYNNMKDILFSLEKPGIDGTSLALCNEKYVKEIENGFEFTIDPQELKGISNTQIELYRKMLKLYSDYQIVSRKSETLSYLYEVNENEYKVTNNFLTDFISSKILTQKNYQTYTKEFYTTKLPKLTKGVILLKDDKFIKMEVISDNNFKLEYLSSAYNATVFSTIQANTIIQILGLQVLKREINTVKLDNNNIVYNTNKENKIFADYKNILDNIAKNRMRMCSFDPLKPVKVESDKGAYEYLRRFYYKGVLDSEALFEKLLLADVNIKNILIVEPVVNIDIIGLSNVCKKLKRQVKLTTLNSYKMGVYPTVYLSEYVTYTDAYRLEFSYLPKAVLSSFDAIVFSRGMLDNKAQFKFLIDELIEEQNLWLVNIKNCNLSKFEDCFNLYFNTVKRKYFNEYDDLDEIRNLSVDTFEKMREGVCKCSLPMCEVAYPIVERQFSYHSIVKILNNKVIDFYQGK